MNNCVLATIVQSILILWVFVSIFLILISIVAHIIRNVILRRHLARLETAGLSCGVKIAGDATIWWPIYGDKIIKQIDKDFAQRLFKLSVLSYSSCTVGVCSLIVLILYWLGLFNK